VNLSLKKKLLKNYSLTTTNLTLNVPKLLKNDCQLSIPSLNLNNTKLGIYRHIWFINDLCCANGEDSFESDVIYWHSNYKIGKKSIYLHNIYGTFGCMAVVNVLHKSHF